MTRTLLTVGLVAAGLLAAAGLTACGDDDPGNQPAPASTAQSRETGIAELDAVIRTVELHDPATLRELLQFSMQACTTELGAGGPPKCRDGELDGTKVSVIEFVGCERGWLRETTSDVGLSIDTGLAQVTAVQSIRYAAFVPPSGYVPHGSHILVFEGPDPRMNGTSKRGVALGVDAGRVVGLSLACGAGAEGASLIPDGQTTFLLEPPP